MPVKSSSRAKFEQRYGEEGKECIERLNAVYLWANELPENAWSKGDNLPLGVIVAVKMQNGKILVFAEDAAGNAEFMRGIRKGYGRVIAWVRAGD